MNQTMESTQSYQGDMTRNQEPVRRGKVLIVDDEPDIVGTLEIYLTENGYKTFGCISAKEALEALRKYEFDLLLIDLVLPEMNGIELLKVTLEIDPHLIGIIITGKGTMESAVDAMKAGAFDYLLKPFKFEMLSTIISRAMMVRQLLKSENKAHSVIRELHCKVKELENSRCQGSGGELEVLELREEVEFLKKELASQRETGEHMFFCGGDLG